MQIIKEFDELEKLSKGIGLNRIGRIFEDLIESMKDYLCLDPIYKNVQIIISNHSESFPEDKFNPFDVGVKRIPQNGNLSIFISDGYIRFLPLILLREAYYNFISVRNLPIQVAINSIVENTFNRISVLKDWILMIKNFSIHDENIGKILSGFKKFFKRERPGSESPTFFLLIMLEIIFL